MSDSTGLLQTLTYPYMNSRHHNDCLANTHFIM